MAVAGALALLASGCGGGEVSVEVAPETSWVDEPVRMTVRGLDPREAVELRLGVTDADRVRWTSSTEARADADGVLDLRRMDIFWLLRPATAPESARLTLEERRPTRFTLDVVSAGETVAATTVDRIFPTSRYDIQTATPADTGFAGVYLAPTSRRRRPPVVVLGGAGGGVPLPLDVFLLAARGHPVLALAYFADQGLPERLSRIRLEYFESALRWLDRRPHADGRGVVAWGISRGSEAALLLGVHYPSLVRAVVALVPSNVSHCGDPCTTPAWTLGGRAVPFTREFDDASPTDDPRAVIPVERIRGPVLAVCGGLDSTWNSCAYSAALADRGDATVHEYPRAGHGLGTLAPYQPTLASEPTYAADQRARAQEWPQVLEFLEAA